MCVAGVGAHAARAAAGGGDVRAGGVAPAPRALPARPPRAQTPPRTHRRHAAARPPGPRPPRRPARQVRPQPRQEDLLPVRTRSGEYRQNMTASRSDHTEPQKLLSDMNVSVLL